MRTLRTFKLVRQTGSTPNWAIPPILAGFSLNRTQQETGTSWGLRPQTGWEVSEWGKLGKDSNTDDLWSWEETRTRTQYWMTISQKHRSQNQDSEHWEEAEQTGEANVLGEPGTPLMQRCYSEAIMGWEFGYAERVPVYNLYPLVWKMLMIRGMGSNGNSCLLGGRLLGRFYLLTISNYCLSLTCLCWVGKHRWSSCPPVTTPLP